MNWPTTTNIKSDLYTCNSSNNSEEIVCKNKSNKDFYLHQVVHYGNKC